LKCTACREEEEEEEHPSTAATGRVQRVCKECEEEDKDAPHSIQRKPDETSSGPTVDERRLQFDGGAPLSSGLRTQVEPLLGYDLGHVRVHQDGRAHEAARDLSARAFTHREHIWLGRGERADDVSLMAHELTHVVQQGAAPTPAPIQRRPLVTPLPATSRGATGGVVQRGVISWAKRKAKGALLWAVRRVSSEIAEIIDKGPLTWLKDKILVPIKSWLGRVFTFPRIGVAIESLKAGWHDAVTLIQGVMRGDPKSCQQFKDLLGGIRAFAAKIADSGPIRLLRSVFGAITKAIGKVYRFVIANAIEALRPIISGAWNLIKKIASKVSGWLSKVKHLVSRAWNWVKEKLGFGGEDGDAGSESGVWAWIKRKATAAWNVIKGPIMRVAGPILTVLKVLSLFTGLGQIYLIIKYGPQVVEVVKWLWANWGDPNMVRKAHKEMSHTFLPRLLDGTGKFGSLLRQGTDWLIGKATALAEGVLTLLGAVTGIPLLGLARRAIAAVSDGVKSVLAWGQNLLSKAADAVTSFFHKIWKAIEPYKEVLSSIVLAIINPPMIPLILAGWAWRLIPDNCIKAAIIDFLLDILIAALEALPDTPFFGPLWPLLRSGVLGFLRGLKAQSDETKEKVSNKIAKIISGASPEFLFGFVKGVLLGVWEGITDPFKAIWTVIEGLHWVGDFLGGLATAALERVSGAPATPASPAAAPAPVATPAASAAPATAVASPSPAAGPAGATPAAHEEDAGPATGDMGELAATATAMAGELGPDLSTVTGNFWDAAKEYFSSGEGMTFGDLAKKFGEFWDALKEKVEGAGKEMAQKVSEFFVSDEAESKIGESVGWLVGTIGFQILLDVLTAGAWAAAYPTLALIARFINWPMEVLGRVFKLLAKLGKYIVDGVKGLGKMVAKAGAGAFKVVTEALGRIGEKLGRFAEEIIGKFVGRGGGRALGAAEREGARVLEAGGAKLAGREGTGVAGRGLVGDVEGAAARDARVADSARVDSPHLTPADANAELAHITDRPGLLEGAPPNRRARIGEHEWVESPGGVWCRHSKGELCTKLPADLEEALKARRASLEADYRKRIDSAPEHLKDDVRFDRHRARAKLEGRDPMKRGDWDDSVERLRASSARGTADEGAALGSVGAKNNNLVAEVGEPRTFTVGDVTVRPDSITPTRVVDVKSIEKGTLFYDAQLRAEKTGAIFGGFDGKPRDLAIVMSNAERGAVRPSGPLAEAASVLHRNNVTGRWSFWDKAVNNGAGGWTDLTKDAAKALLGL